MMAGGILEECEKQGLGKIRVAARFVVGVASKRGPGWLKCFLVGDVLERAA